MPTIYRHKDKFSFDPLPFEIAHGPNGWHAVGGSHQDVHDWETYIEAVVLQGKDPAWGEGKLFPVAYFIDADLRLPVTKSWLHDQANGGEVISSS